MVMIIRNSFSKTNQLLWLHNGGKEKKRMSIFFSVIPTRWIVVWYGKKVQSYVFQPDLFNVSFQKKKIIRIVFPVIIRWCLMCGHSINTKNMILNYTSNRQSYSNSYFYCYLVEIKMKIYTHTHSKKRFNIAVKPQSVPIVLFHWETSQINAN